MAIIREKVETGRNSDVTLAFLVDGQPIQHHSLTKVEFYIGPVAGQHRPAGAVRFEPSRPHGHQNGPGGLAQGALSGTDLSI